MTRLRHLPRFRQARELLPLLESRESWSRDEIATFQLAHINQTWRHAVQCVPFYRRLQQERSLPASFCSLDEYSQLMPILPKAAVRDFPDELLSAEHAHGRWQRTGGTTGIPTRVFRSVTAHREALAVRYRCLQEWDVDFLQRHAMLWGHANSFDPGLRGHAARMKRPLVDWLRGRRRLSAYQMTPDNVQRYLNRMNEYAPAWMYGYSSAVYLLALGALRHQIPVPTLRLSVLTAEPVFAPMVATIEQAFESPAIAEYGSVETGIMATEGRDRRLRVREDVVFMESIDRGDGFFRLVVTVLNNPTFPLLRFDVGDVTDRPIETPDRGFSVLSNVAGRNNDILQSRQGRLINALAVKNILSNCDGVLRFRAHQAKDGVTQVTIEKSRSTDQVDVSAAEPQLVELLDGYDVSFDFVDYIPGNDAGKHRWITSELISTATQA